MMSSTGKGLESSEQLVMGERGSDITGTCLSIRLEIQGKITRWFTGLEIEQNLQDMLKSHSRSASFRFLLSNHDPNYIIRSFSMKLGCMYKATSKLY